MDIQKIIEAYGDCIVCYCDFTFVGFRVKAIFGDTVSWDHGLPYRYAINDNGDIAVLYYDIPLEVKNKDKVWDHIDITNPILIGPDPNLGEALRLEAGLTET